MVDNYRVTYGGYVDLEVEDFIRVVNFSNPYEPYVITKISKVTDKSIFVEGYNTSFDYNGIERGGRRKSKLKLDFPTQEDINNYKERGLRTSLISQIKEVVEDWDNLGEYKTSVLKKINDLLRDENSKLPLFS